MVASSFELKVVVLEAVRVDCLIIAFCLMTGESLQTRGDAPIAQRTAGRILCLTAADAEATYRQMWLGHLT